MKNHSMRCMNFLLLSLLAAGLLAPAWAAEDAKEPSSKKVDVAYTDAQKKAIAEIEKLGGLVLRVAANTDAHSVNFALQGSGLTDAGLGLLKDVPNLVSLNLKGTKVTDAGMAAVAQIATLEALHLEKTAITDAGVASLAGLKNLSYLNVYGNPGVTDKSLATIQAMPKLTRVYAWESKIGKDEAKKAEAAKKGLAINVGWDAPPVVVAPPPPPPAKKDDKKKNKDIVAVMEKVHKGDANAIIQKILAEKGSPDDLKTLVACYEVLAKTACPKGDANEWKAMTAALLDSAKKVQAGDKAALAQLKTASDCKACHTKFKG